MSWAQVKGSFAKGTQRLASSTVGMPAASEAPKSLPHAAPSLTRHEIYFILSRCSRLATLCAQLLSPRWALAAPRATRKPSTRVACAARQLNSLSNVNSLLSSNVSRCQFAGLLVLAGFSALPACGASPAAEAEESGPPPIPYVALSAGFAHACLVHEDGTLRCWGNDLHGQLGNGTADYGAFPVSRPASVTGVALVAAGYMQTCALLQDGSVQCWGSNDNTQLGNASTQDSLVPITVSGLQGATTLSVGNVGACVGTNGGGAVCWGANEFGELGNGTMSAYGGPAPVQGLGQVKALGSGVHFNCALLVDGSVSCWGSNSNEQLGNDDGPVSPVPVAVQGIADATELAVGDDHACVVKADGTVACWGLGAGQFNSITAIPRVIPGVTNATAVAAGDAHSCALGADGTVSCWGANGFGQLGAAEPPNSDDALPVSGLSDVRAISAGYGYTCALTRVAVYCFGRNSEGQLGDDAGVDSPTPIEVVGL